MANQFTYYCIMKLKKLVKLQICGENSLVQIQMESSRDIPIIIQLKFTDLVQFFQRKMDSKKISKTREIKQSNERSMALLVVP